MYLNILNTAAVLNKDVGLTFTAKTSSGVFTVTANGPTPDRSVNNVLSCISKKNHSSTGQLGSACDKQFQANVSFTIINIESISYNSKSKIFEIMLQTMLHP